MIGTDALLGALNANAEHAVARLTLDLIESGALTKETAVPLLTRLRSPEAPVTLILDVLRIAARLEPRMKGMGPHWIPDLIEPVRGLPSAAERQDRSATSTPEDLAASAAVVEFILRAPGQHVREGYLTDPKTGRSAKWKRIANPHLDRLVRERPGDLDLIVAHLRGQDMDREGKSDVDALRARLAAHAPGLDGRPA